MLTLRLPNEGKNLPIWFRGIAIKLISNRHERVLCYVKMSEIIPPKHFAILLYESFPHSTSNTNTNYCLTIVMLRGDRFTDDLGSYFNLN